MAGISSADGAEVAAIVQEDRLPTDSLAASMLMLLVLMVVQRLVGFLRGVLFCRWLDARQLGQWDLAYGFLMLAAPLVVLGLPGSFGRYTDYYRQRGQLRSFLRRTIGCSLLLTVLAMIGVTWGCRGLAELVFGSSEQGPLMCLLGLVLGVVIIDNVFTSLYMALRQVKFVSLMQFANGLTFALLGIALLLFWQARTASVVIAICAACLLTSSVSLLRLKRIWSNLPRAGQSLSGRSLWAKLAPFAFWLWLANWLSNLSIFADRFMLIHFTGLAPAAALNLVGQYHTARIFPLLFINAAELLGAVIMPHVSVDWETGRRQAVSARLRLMLKAFGLGLVTASTLVLAAAPMLFNHVWQERYADGLMVLPWALVCSVWICLASVSYNYLWCAERSRWVCLTLFLGLALNVALNLLLLPRLGLQGAVLSAAAARLASLGLLWWLIHRLGMPIDGGLIVIAALPLVLCLGPGAAAAVLLAVVFDLVPGVRCFDAGEKARLAEMIRASRLKLTAFALLGKPATAEGRGSSM